MIIHFAKINTSDKQLEIQRMNKVIQSIMTIANRDYKVVSLMNCNTLAECYRELKNYSTENAVIIIRSTNYVVLTY